MKTIRRGKISSAFALLLLTLPAAQAGILRANKVLLLCHRTANRHLPENTLESLALAARMGCDIVEVDVRRTADGELVLNHDGFLDRFTDTTGEIENTDSRELDRMDFGSWMGERFKGMHIAHFDDALHLARELNVGLYLDIKTSGIGRQVLAALDREGMTDHVIFGGEWDDIRALKPTANEDASVGLEPGFTREQVQALRAQGKLVIANFILNGHEFDLDGMRQAVALGADGIMVDYPRLGAEAVGRPVEEKISVLSKQADQGATQQRLYAIRELSSFIGLPLQKQFLRWLLDPDEQISHEAALALVLSRPRPDASAFETALHSASAAARSNAAWAIGAIATDAPRGAKCASFLVPLLKDKSAIVVKQTLVATSRCPADSEAVPANTLLAILNGREPVLRGLAAVALAKHHPHLAVREVQRQLAKEETESDSFNEQWTARGRQKLSQAEIDRAVELYRAEMKELQALARLPDRAATEALASQAFRPGHDYSTMQIIVAGFDLWHRLEEDPTPALQALASDNTAVADSAEWTLVQAGPEVLPAVRKALIGSHGDLQRRLIQILAWQGDQSALPLLRSMAGNDGSNEELLRWAITLINAFSTRAAGEAHLKQ